MGKFVVGARVFLCLTGLLQPLMCHAASFGENACHKKCDYGSITASEEFELATIELQDVAMGLTIKDLADELPDYRNQRFAVAMFFTFLAIASIPGTIISVGEMCAPNNLGCRLPAACGGGLVMVGLLLLAYWQDLLYQISPCMPCYFEIKVRELLKYRQLNDVLTEDDLRNYGAAILRIMPELWSKLSPRQATILKQHLCISLDC